MHGGDEIKMLLIVFVLGLFPRLDVKEPTQNRKWKKEEEETHSLSICRDHLTHRVRELRTHSCSPHLSFAHTLLPNTHTHTHTLQAMPVVAKHAQSLPPCNTHTRTHTHPQSFPSLSPVLFFSAVSSFSIICVHVTKDLRAYSIHEDFSGMESGRKRIQNIKILEAINPIWITVQGREWEWKLEWEWIQAAQRWGRTDEH